MFVEINGVRLNTVSFGTGERTFLAHGGFVGGWEMWQQPLELLSKDWRCVSFDHRGAGQSRVPPETITREAMVDDILALMDHLEIDHCVIGGESMGGGIVTQALLQHPDRFDGLVLVNSILPASEAPSEQRMNFINFIRSDFPAAMKGFIRRCITEPDSEHFKRWATDISLRSDPESAVSLLRVFEQGDGDPWEAPLGEISVPTLVIHGSEDEIVPLETAQSLAERIPDSELVNIDGAGHVPLYTFPYELVQAINRRFPK